MMIKNWPMLAAGLVSIITLLGTVWFAAISVNNSQTTVNNVATEVSEMSGVVKSWELRLHDIENEQRELRNTTLRIVYVGKDSVMLSTEGGDTFTLPFVELVKDRFTKDDGNELSGRIDQLKKYLVKKGVCEDIRTCG